MPSLETKIPNLSGQSFDNGRYKLMNPIGSGAFGVVYRAHEYIPESNTSIIRAVKVSPRYKKGSFQRLNQDRETVLHRKVSQIPNVVTLHRVVHENGYQYMVLDYQGGGDLRRIIDKKRSLARNEPVLRELFLQIIDGVEACHGRGVYHRDLKPENILVNEDLTEVYIADFGLATLSKQSTTFNVGTKFFECPECVECDDVEYPYDTRRNDTWALGITLIHMTTGRLPWGTATIEDRHFVNFLENPNHLRTIFPISPGLNDILHRALTIIPDEACSLSEFRKLIRNLDRFWLTEKEVERSRYLAVKETWRTYSPVEPVDALSEDSGASSESWASACGDVLESDTSSESGGTLEDNCRVSDFSDGPRSAPKPASAVLKVDKRTPPPLPPRPQPKPQPQPQPEPVLDCLDEPSQPEPPAVMQSASSDEFPIRAPGSHLAGDATPESPASSGSEPDSNGPDTPPTRPHDPPTIVTSQPLSGDLPLQPVEDTEESKVVFGYARKMSLVFWALMYGQLDA
uniref:Protein kinase domain-containing protein n=1 Tax=Ganoderma boninense TaxID=34458 RepID=A0A5K1JV10_9APHY|nr:Protein kinase domain-containing protein [Ganoderma boninense]